MAAILLAAPLAVAQRQSFRYYGQEQGLSNLATECLLQDRTGYLWVGTQNGLFRYDGAAFTPFGEAEGLPSAPIHALVETSEGELWVATARGIARRRGNRFEAHHFPTPVENAGHFGLAADSAGGLYLTTTAGLVVSRLPVAGSERTFVRIHNQPPGPAYGVHVDRSGTTWFGCGSQVCEYAGKSFKIYSPAEGVPPDRWDAVLVDRENTVWIRSSQHLLRKLARSSRFEGVGHPIPHRGDFASLSVGKDGELFVPTDEGVWELANGRWRGIGHKQGLLPVAVGAVLQDREGSIWIGLWGAGLARWVGRNEWEGWTRADGLSGEHVWKMARDHRGSLWVATDNGVNQMRDDPRTGSSVTKVWTEREGLAGNKTRALAIAPDGSVWVGSSPGGISRIDPTTGRTARFALPDIPGSDRIWHLGFDRSGTLWVSTRAGLFYSPAKGAVQFVRQELPSGDATETVSATLEDRRGRLWAAGTRGLTLRENGVWQRFTAADGLPSTAAGFLAEANDGSIWLGYRDKTGLSRLQVTNGKLTVFENHGKGSGMRSSQAIFVRVDRRGWVWFGTDRGVEVLRNGSWRHYGEQDGLIWDDCDTDAFFEDTDGSVWIGTSRGLAHFRVPATQSKPDSPRVEFTHVQLGDKVMDLGSRITQPHYNRSLVARLSVLTFLAEADVLCRYRVVGLDENWVETKQREVRFSNLPPGKYVLEALARSAAGQWSANPARVPFEILPPWWATWWFRTVLGLSIALLIMATIRWRTQRLTAEQARLEEAVAQRTLELLNEQARIEQQNSEIERLLDQARQANRLKDEFLANMSHEIRTPINGIFGMVNFTLGTELKTEQREALETVNSCAQSLLGVLNDILDLSKIEAGRLEITPAPCRIADVLQSACSTFSATAREKSIQLDWDVSAATPEWLECDAGRIRQVVLNLVGNAMKFTHQGQVRVSGKAINTADGSTELHVTVKDTGIGISAESRALIFEAFRQADGSTSRTYGGTGLGLTISSRLVRLMGGELSVDSEPGTGSVFSFWVKARPTVAPSEPGEPVRDAEDQPPLVRPLRILLAEDNLVNQKVATALLSKRGHDVVVVGNGRLAVDRSASDRFDLILMDLQMPEMDGWSAARQIRQREATSSIHVPIIALTAHAMSHAQQECLAAGMDSVIVKPFEPAQLYAAVESAVC